MPDAQGNIKGIAVPRIPWHESKPVSSSDDPVWVDASGQYVNAEGEPLSEEDFDLRA